MCIIKHGISPRVNWKEKEIFLYFIALNRQNPRRHVILKKTAKCVQYVHSLEEICLLVCTFTSILGVVQYFMYVFHFINHSYPYGVWLSTKVYDFEVNKIYT